MLRKRRLKKNLIRNLLFKQDKKKNTPTENENVENDIEIELKDKKEKNPENIIEIKRYRKKEKSSSCVKRKITNVTIKKLSREFKYVSLKNIYSKIEKLLNSNVVKKFLRLICTIGLLALVINCIDIVNRKIFLDVNSREITWAISKDLDANGYEYKLFRNKKHLVTTKARKFTESISLDKESPNKVGNIKINKSSNVYMFSWKEVEDKGSIYTYKVDAVNKKFGKTYSSRAYKTTIMSGVEKYVVILDGKKHDSYVSNFSVNINSLRYGKHNLSVAAVDFAGNISTFKKIEFKVDNTKFFINDYKLATNNIDITNESHEIYLIKEHEVIKDGKTVIQQEEMPISIGDYIHTYFRSDEVYPIANPRYLYEHDMLNVTWEENIFGDNNTEFYIKCKSKNSIKTYISEKMVYTLGDFLPGYYYQVNKEPIYTITKSDNYTMDNNVNLDYKMFNRQNIYYFHVAAANEYGNLSKTKTLELDLANFTSVGEKKDAIRGLLYKTKGLTGDNFRKITDDLYNTFTYNTIKKLQEIDLKIVVSQIDISEYVKLNHNIEIENEDIYYVKDDLTLVYNMESSIDLIIKEIVKILDESKKNPVSLNSDFISLYNQEKSMLSERVSTPLDYLGEVVTLYMNDASFLKATTPKTYEYIKVNYKNIMFTC